ncbi:MAG TPA: DUF3667 domain-containing protein [Chthoniobacterales bacterium]|nr:DUF3667 domain-containing protein [Chthoniobacterales bacterium]
METAAGECANCGAPLTAKYCAACGERRLERDHLKLSNFAAAAVEEITDLEHSKLLRTLQALFLQPGLLTNEYLRGRRQSFIGPVKVYLTIFALSFLIYSIYQPTAVYDVQTFLNQDSNGNWQTVLSAVEKKVHLPQNAVIAEVNTRWRSYVTLTQGLYPLGLAVLLQIIYLRSRRYFVEHLIFSLHFNSVAFGVFVLLWPVYAIVGLRFTLAYSIVSTVSLLLPLVWLLIAVRRVYGQSWSMTTLKSITVAIGYLIMSALVSVATLGLAFLMLLRSG